MEELLDKHAPKRKVTIRKHLNCPWFDGECKESKHQTRRLERSYRQQPCDVKEELWRKQVTKQRRLFQQKRSNYLRQRVADAQGDGKTLWKSLHNILSPPSDMATND